MSGEKTEQPTPKKLRDLREKGQVPFSKEVPSAALTIAFFALFLAIGGYVIERAKALILMAPTAAGRDFTNAADTLLQAYIGEMIAILSPFLLLALLVGIGACVLQFGVLFSLEAAKPSLDKLNPANYFKNTFSRKNAIELVKSILKIVVLALTIYFIVRSGIQAMVTSTTCGMPCQWAVFRELLWTLAIWSAGPFIVVAAADLAFQKWDYTQKNMMSKDEVKREYKESEGDPLIKGMRRQLHQQMIAEGKVDRARQATVLVTNPTHVAVAIVYDEGKTPLPIVSAVGTDNVARRMIEAAERAGVPVMRNVPLARGLLEHGQVDQYVPSDLLQPMAEVLRVIRNLAPQ